MSIQYSGFKLYEGWTIDRVSPDISPETFFEEYVAKRKPVIISGHLKDGEWKGHLWTNSYLKEKAGESVVNVEEKGNNGLFGTSLPRIKMKFGELIDKIEKGSTQNYLTTQYENDEDDEDDDTDISVRDFCSPPLDKLISDFPFTPSILGNLVVQTTNIWFGNSEDGTSSGLHHDFHDNLYILLRGRKRFTIFSPENAHNLYTYGKIKNVYPNGLICYEDEDVREDGAPTIEVIRYQSFEANMRYDKALETGDEELIEEAKRECDEALERLFEYESNFGDMEDDFSMGSYDSDFSKDSFEENKKKNNDTPNKEPNSFSKIDYISLHQKIAPKQFSKLNRAIRAQFEVKSGEMLFLPAGWFHEVTSYSDGDNGHLAFNYWCSPCTLNNFYNPYPDNFWKDKWSEIKVKLENLRLSMKKRTANEINPHESSKKQKISN